MILNYAIQGTPLDAPGEARPLNDQHIENYWEILQRSGGGRNVAFVNLLLTSCFVIGNSHLEAERFLDSVFSTKSIWAKGFTIYLFPHSFDNKHWILIWVHKTDRTLNICSSGGYNYQDSEEFFRLIRRFCDACKRAWDIDLDLKQLDLREYEEDGYSCGTYLLLRLRQLYTEGKVRKMSTRWTAQILRSHMIEEFKQGRYIHMET